LGIIVFMVLSIWAVIAQFLISNNK